GRGNQDQATCLVLWVLGNLSGRPGAWQGERPASSVTPGSSHRTRSAARPFSAVGSPAWTSSSRGPVRSSRDSRPAFPILDSVVPAISPLSPARQTGRDAFADPGRRLFVALSSVGGGEHDVWHGLGRALDACRQPRGLPA